MSTQVQSHLIPAGNNSWYVLEDTYFKGGLRTIPSLHYWPLVPQKSRKAGMFIQTEDDLLLYTVDHDLIHLSEFKLPAARERTTVIHTTVPMSYNELEEFQIEMGFSSTVYRLEVDGDCVVQAFGTPARDEENPYEFFAKGGGTRYVDVGFTYLEDGTVSKSNKFFRLTNLEEPPTELIYFRIISKNEQQEKVPIKLTIVFYPEEY